MSFFKKKYKVTVLAVAAVAVLSAFIGHFTGENPIVNTVRTVLSPFQSGFSYIAYKIDKTINFIWEADIYKALNDQLQQRVTELERQNRDVAQYVVENERLNELLGLQESLSQFGTVAARVIGYSSNRWYDKIEINKGALSGINKGNTVICNDGVVGLVEEVGPDWAIVSTIINPDAAIGVRIVRTGDVGVVEGDDSLCYSSQCKLTFVDKGVNLIEGDMLETSGAGGMYPAGFIVGTVRGINSDNMGLLDHAIIEPKADFADLHEVLVINRIGGME